MDKTLAQRVRRIVSAIGWLAALALAVGAGWKV